MANNVPGDLWRVLDFNEIAARERENGTLCAADNTHTLSKQRRGASLRFVSRETASDICDPLFGRLDARPALRRLVNFAIIIIVVTIIVIAPLESALHHVTVITGR